MTVGKVSPSSCACQPASTPPIACHRRTITPENHGAEEHLASPYRGEGNDCAGDWYGTGFSTLPETFGKWDGSSWAYGYMVAKEMRKLSVDLSARAEEMKRCGQVVAVRECECCGETRAGSGTFREVSRTCNGRSCPYCSWVRAQERVELLGYAARTLPRVDGYEWQLLTQSLQYDPDVKSDDMSVGGLRARIALCARVWRELWKKGLKAPGASLLRCIEVSDRGHVHVHAVYYGPPVDEKWMAEVGRKLTRRGCRSTAKRIKGQENGVKKAARYAAKSVKGSAAAFNEDFLAGETGAWLLHPQLAARWELAAKDRRLVEPYGAIRGLSVPRPDEEGGPHDDGDVQCSCGSTGRYRTIYRNVKSYLIECHLDGKAGIEGNRWLPYWMRENVRRKKIRERGKRKRK